MPFVKLDQGILNSSLWVDVALRDVFITALLLSRPHELREPTEQLDIETGEPTGFVIPRGWYGWVDASPIGLISRAIIEPEKGFAALRRLGLPEAGSRSKAFDGRRLARVDGGFVVLNYVTYRDRDHTAGERMTRYRLRQREARERQRGQTPSDPPETEPAEPGDLSPEGDNRYAVTGVTDRNERGSYAVTLRSVTHTYTDTDTEDLSNEEDLDLFREDLDPRNISALAKKPRARKRTVEADGQKTPAEPTQPNPIPQVLDYFREAWQAKYREALALSYGRHVRAVKDLIAQVGVDKLKASIDGYLAVEEPFELQARHSVSAWLANPSRYLVAPREAKPTNANEVRKLSQTRNAQALAGMTVFVPGDVDDVAHSRPSGGSGEAIGTRARG